MIFRNMNIWVYRTLSSLRTSVWLLGLMIIFYIIGTIFPQGVEFEEYVRAGGEFQSIVRTFGLLNIFFSPLFIVISLILTLNLSVCIFERLRRYITKKVKTIAAEDIRSNPRTIFIDGVTKADVEVKLQMAKFKVKEKTENATTFEKGMPYQWLSWIYHLGMVISIAGFMLSALFSFEKEINLKPHIPQQIYTQSPDTRFNRVIRTLGINVQSKEGFRVILKEFSTEYTEGMKLKYPKEKLSRLAIGLGWKTEKFSQEVKLIPKRYISRVAIYEGESLIKEKDILVNHPLRNTYLKSE